MTGRQQKEQRKNKNKTWNWVQWTGKKYKKEKDLDLERRFWRWIPKQKKTKWVESSVEFLAAKNILASSLCNQLNDISDNSISPALQCQWMETPLEHLRGPCANKTHVSSWLYQLQMTGPLNRQSLVDNYYACFNIYYVHCELMQTIRILMPLIEILYQQLG